MLFRSEDFRLFLLDAPQGGNKKGTISQNTASTYFAIFKAGLKQAFVDGYFVSDIAAKIKGIKEKEARREYLTIEELNRLVCTPCDNATIKRAVLFSALTGPDFDYASPILDFSIFRGQNRHFCPPSSIF